ncbi:MAG: rhomboid family intramembrane serine protease [Planctomycetota bacterium]|nr:MAG: rhomboid family intramembrane serine protease [Planctomycetota bacterium]
MPRVGLEDRHYMHEDRPSSPVGGAVLAPSGLSTTARLIIANAVVFLAWQFLPGRIMAAHFTVGWDGLVHHYRVWTLLTSAFSHMDFWHALWNMLFLYWFGPDVENAYGRRNYLFLYGAGALACSLAHVAYEHAFGHDLPALGASGAVMAVVVVTAILHPRRTILFLFVIPMPLWLLALLKVLGDLSGALTGGTGVTHAGHLGGAAAGALYWAWARRFGPPLDAGRGGPGLLARLRRRWKARRFRLVPPDPPEPGGPKVDAATKQRVDALLRKIHEQGLDALSPEERRFLDEASRRFRK